MKMSDGGWVLSSRLQLCCHKNKLSVTDGPTDEPTKRGLESRERDLKLVQKPFKPTLMKMSAARFPVAQQQRGY